MQTVGVVANGVEMEERVWNNKIAKCDLFSDYFVLFLSDPSVHRMEFWDAVATYSFTIHSSLLFAIAIPFRFGKSFSCTFVLLPLCSQFICAMVFPIKYAQYFAALRFNKIQQYLTGWE